MSANHARSLDTVHDDVAWQQALDDACDAVAREHRELVRVAVLAQGAPGIADRLVAAVGGWALLLDEQGELQTAAPAGARARVERIRIELPRFSAGGLTSAVLSRPGDTALIRAVVSSGRIRAFLAIGKTTPLTPTERSLVETAAHLLADDLHRTDLVRRAARNDRLALFRLMVDGHVDVANSTGTILGVPLPSGTVRVAVLESPRSHATELIETAEEDLALRRITTVIAELQPGRIGIVLPEAEGDVRTLEAVLRNVPHARGAVSEPTDIVALPESWQNVSSVLRAAPDVAGRLYVAQDVADTGLLKYFENDEARAWAQATLAPLESLDHASKVDFVHTLRVYLANNGRADASANRLDIHRHTLRYRMTRIEESIGRSLDDPNVRSELWIALQLRQPD
jgi:purine catabolism regulator